MPLLALVGAIWLLVGWWKPLPSEVPPSPPAAATTAFADAATSTATAFGTAKPLERVVKLYEAESKRIGQVDPDPALTEERLSTAAKDLNAEEIAWLAAQALDEKNEMDARFFAAYLAALARSPSAVAALKSIAAAPLPKTKNEMRFAEERALRMQAVEGLSRNCKVGTAKDDLLELVAVQDEGVRDRAHRALYACQTGKKIEDGDKEALEKLKAK